MTEDKFMVFEKVAEILAQYKELEVGDISPETTLEQLGLDSLDKVELIMRFEEAFEIEIDMETPMQTAQDLVDEIEKQTQGGAQA
jgi:acyl carrier protein